MHHRIDERNIGSGPLLHIQFGDAAQRNTARIRNDKLCPAGLNRLPDHYPHYRMTFGRIGADHKNERGRFELVDAVCHSPASKSTGESGDRRSVT